MPDNNNNNRTTNENRVNTVFDGLMYNATVTTLKFIKETLKFIKDSFLSMLYLCIFGPLLVISFFSMMFIQGLEETIRDLFSNQLSTNRSDYYTTRFTDFIEKINTKILKILTIYYVFKDKRLVDTIPEEQFIPISRTFKFEPNEKNISNCKDFLDQILSSDYIKDHFFTSTSTVNPHKKETDVTIIGEYIAKFMSYLEREYGYITDNEEYVNSPIESTMKYKLFFDDLINNPIKKRNLNRLNESHSDKDYFIKRYSEAINKYLDNENKIDKKNKEEQSNDDNNIEELKDSTKFQNQSKEEQSNDDNNIEELKDSTKFQNQSKDNIRILTRSNSFNSYFNIKKQNNNLTRSKSIK